ncbi:hypothetical protein GCM10011389_14070 [Pontibacillus salipaludis]|uniref:Uncharacterized protein n=1 Tax=Pontibacillus salipaludis TaxID=1697394 RepID=A0ABQ1PZX3_9BACI|nr:hypothetical protein GCM10011389_14070 [Pontibacillus salipaludis]
MINPEKFIEMFGNKEPEELVKLAQVDPDYTSGRPRLIFDGETVISKQYPYASSYTPSPNDRVLVLKGVVICAIK